MQGGNLVQRVKTNLWFIGIITILLLGGLVFSFFLHEFKKSLDYGFEHPSITTIKIPAPECFLPDKDKDLKKLISRLNNSNEWKVEFKSDNKNWHLNYLYAARLFELNKKDELSPNGFIWKHKVTNVYGYQIALIDTSNQNTLNKYVSSEYLLSRASCQNNGYLYLKTYYDFKFGIRSRLLIGNKKCGLYIEEWSEDPKRKFTETALKSTVEEIAKCPKGE